MSDVESMVTSSVMFRLAFAFVAAQDPPLQVTFVVGLFEIVSAA